DDLEALLEYYLGHEDERRALADAARAKVPGFTYEALWGEQVARLEADWPALAERAARRVTESRADPEAASRRVDPGGPAAPAGSNPKAGPPPSAGINPAARPPATAGSGAPEPVAELLGRTWQALSSTRADDPTLADDLKRALRDRPAD